MSVGLPLQSSHEFNVIKSYTHVNQSKILKVKGQARLLSVFSSCASQQDRWSRRVSDRIYRPMYYIPYRYNVLSCRSFSLPGSANKIPILKSTVSTLTRSYNALQGCPLLLQLVPAFGVITFALWGLGQLLRHSRSFFLRRNDASWKKSRTHYVLTSYLRPLLLWAGAILVCRVLDPVSLPSEASQVVKQRLLNFVRSLSTVMAFAYCLSSLILQMQKFLMETNDPSDARNMGYQFAGKAVYSAVWVAAVSLFMELLGFSTQKWLTAGGLGTVLLTLAGREIFTNFLSSVMIHATRPFVVNEWIQTKIEGYEVSGTVEHVGWWSPTIIRGEDREAIHIPNHKFTVNVVRNLTQKTHWRIKTHLAISHLDANKINNIVADMRKVLAKNPQVEQQRLHRRVFLEFINPENQAFMILVSCFVKTSHFEEYLCVKEAVLLDLLRVISHHRARLATPIRTVQKIYSETGTENIPFADTIFTRTGPRVHRPLYLIDSTARINGDDKTKAHPAPRMNEELSKTALAADQKGTGPLSEGSTSDSKRQQKAANSGDSPPAEGNNIEDKQQQKKAKSVDNRVKGRASDLMTPSTSNSSTKSQPEGFDSKGPNSKNSTRSGAASEKPPAHMLEPGSEQVDAIPPGPVHAKHDGEKLPTMTTPGTRPILKENIVLGVALDGAKRTLPIQGMGLPGSGESKELAGCLNGNGSPPLPAKDKKDGHVPAVPCETPADQRDHER